MPNADTIAEDLTAEALPEAKEVPPERWTSAILRSLAAADAPLTLQDVELAVGRQVPVAGPAPIREEIELLRRYEFLELVGTTRTVTLTADGRALAAAFEQDQR